MSSYSDSPSTPNSLAPTPSSTPVPTTPATPTSSSRTPVFLRRKSVSFSHAPDTVHVIADSAGSVAHIDQVLRQSPSTPSPIPSISASLSSSPSVHPQSRRAEIAAIIQSASLAKSSQRAVNENWRNPESSTPVSTSSKHPLSLPIRIPLSVASPLAQRSPSSLSGLQEEMDLLPEQQQSDIVMGCADNPQPGPLVLATATAASFIPSSLRSLLPVKLHISITEAVARVLDEALFPTHDRYPIDSPFPSLTPDHPLSQPLALTLPSSVSHPSSSKSLLASLDHLISKHAFLVRLLQYPVKTVKKYIGLVKAVTEYSKAELTYLSHLSVLQARTVLSTVAQHAVEGSPRKSWGFDLHLILNTLRHTTALPHQSLNQARRPSLIANYLPSRLLGADVKITQVRWKVDTEKIVEEERRGREWSGGGVGGEGLVVVQFPVLTVKKRSICCLSGDGTRYIIPPEYPTSIPSTTVPDSPPFTEPSSGASISSDVPSCVFELEAEWVEVVPQGEQSAGVAGMAMGVKGMIKDWVFGKKQQRGWDENEKVVLYLHGGAYTMLSPATHRSLTSRIARATSTRLFVPAYRLAPEHPFPAALHDAFAAWLYLTKPDHPALGGRRWAKRYKPENVTVMGDSAGGGLAVALMVYLKAFLGAGEGGQGFGMPGGAVLMSPWVDLTCSHPSYILNSNLDYLPFPPDADVFTPMYRSDNSPNPVAAYLWGWEGKRGLERSFCTREHVAWERIARRQTRRSSVNGECSDDEEGRLGSRRWDLGSDNGSLSRTGTLIRRSASAPPAPVADPGDVVPFTRENSLLGKPVVGLGVDYVKTLVQVRHPCVSPLFADLRGLPPVLIQAGDCELLRDESIELARKYSAANQRRPSLVGREPALHEDKQGHVRHELYTDMVHVFQAFSFTQASKIAVANIGRFHRNLYSRPPPDGAEMETDREQCPFEEDEAVMTVNTMGETGDVMVTFRNVDIHEGEGSEMEEGLMDTDEVEYGDEEAYEGAYGGEQEFYNEQQNWMEARFGSSEDDHGKPLPYNDQETDFAGKRWFGPGDGTRHYMDESAAENSSSSDMDLDSAGRHNVRLKTKSILKKRSGFASRTYNEALVAMAVSSESDSWLRGEGLGPSSESDDHRKDVATHSHQITSKTMHNSGFAVVEQNSIASSSSDWWSGGMPHPLSMLGIW
ncbi:hypothetical protein HDU93_007167 [Gonapodya sp. JEL0774]|nr:hypothetical protein HDU93_007167 [Gonapodya sp. JEL0774]